MHTHNSLVVIAIHSVQKVENELRVYTPNHVAINYVRSQAFQSGVYVRWASAKKVLGGFYIATLIAVRTVSQSHCMKMLI